VPPSVSLPEFGAGGCVAAAYVEQPARVDERLWLEAAARFERDPGVLGVQVWRAAHDPAHAATSEAKRRPGGDRRIEAAMVVDVMRERDGRALEGSVCAVLPQGATPGSGTGSVPVQYNVYRLLGLWRAPDVSKAMAADAHETPHRPA
jgi:hypothetical protein